MPQRFLKPGLRESPRWNQASWPAQSLFARLVTLVDDYARFDAHPLLIARVAFPYGTPNGKRITPEQVQEWLEELQRLDLLILYTINAVPVLQLRRWTERIRMKNPSRFPPPTTEACPHLPADVVRCCQMTANAALPTSTATSTATSVPYGEEAVETNGAIASRTQFAALREQVARLEATPREARTVEHRDELKKKRAELEILQKKQAAGNFKVKGNAHD